MEYEYVALIDQPRHGTHWNELVAEGWCEWMKIPYWTRPHLCGTGPSYVYVMRKPKIWEDLMTVQEIESTDLGRILEKVKSAKALGLPFTLTAEVETKKRGQHKYRSLLYTLCIETTPRGAVNLTIGDNLLVKE